jgi:hypothetical protein
MPMAARVCSRLRSRCSGTPVRANKTTGCGARAHTTPTRRFMDARARRVRVCVCVCVCVCACARVCVWGGVPVSMSCRHSHADRSPSATKPTLRAADRAVAVAAMSSRAVGERVVAPGTSSTCARTQCTQDARTSPACLSRKRVRSACQGSPHVPRRAGGVEGRGCAAVYELRSEV